jgi:hypothetical protein
MPIPTPTNDFSVINNEFSIIGTSPRNKGRNGFIRSVGEGSSWGVASFGNPQRQELKKQLKPDDNQEQREQREKREQRGEEEEDDANDNDNDDKGRREQEEEKGGQEEEGDQHQHQHQQEEEEEQQRQEQQHQQDEDEEGHQKEVVAELMVALLADQQQAKTPEKGQGNQSKWAVLRSVVRDKEEEEDSEDEDEESRQFQAKLRGVKEKRRHEKRLHDEKLAEESKRRAEKQRKQREAVLKAGERQRRKDAARAREVSTDWINMNSTTLCWLSERPIEGSEDQEEEEEVTKEEEEMTEEPPPTASRKLGKYDGGGRMSPKGMSMLDHNPAETSDHLGAWAEGNLDESNDDTYNRLALVQDAAEAVRQRRERGLGSGMQQQEVHNASYAKHLYDKQGGKGRKPIKGVEALLSKGGTKEDYERWNHAVVVCAAFISELREAGAGDGKRKQHQERLWWYHEQEAVASSSGSAWYTASARRGSSQQESSASSGGMGLTSSPAEWPTVRAIRGLTPVWASELHRDQLIAEHLSGSREEKIRAAIFETPCMPLPVASQLANEILLALVGAQHALAFDAEGCEWWSWSDVREWRKMPASAKHAFILDSLSKPAAGCDSQAARLLQLHEWDKQEKKRWQKEQRKQAVVVEQKEPTEQGEEVLPTLATAIASLDSFVVAFMHSSATRELTLTKRCEEELVVGAVEKLRKRRNVKRKRRPIVLNGAALAPVSKRQAACEQMLRGFIGALSVCEGGPVVAAAAVASAFKASSADGIDSNVMPIETHIAWLTLFGRLCGLPCAGKVLPPACLYFVTRTLTRAVGAFTALSRRNWKTKVPPPAQEKGGKKKKKKPKGKWAKLRNAVKTAGGQPTAEEAAGLQWVEVNTLVKMGLRSAAAAARDSQVFAGKLEDDDGEDVAQHDGADRRRARDGGEPLMDNPWKGIELGTRVWQPTWADRYPLGIVSLIEARRQLDSAISDAGGADFVDAEAQQQKLTHLVVTLAVDPRSMPGFRYAEETSRTNDLTPSIQMVCIQRLLLHVVEMWEASAAKQLIASRRKSLLSLSQQ